ncbi:MAG: type II secretion system F family protein [Clostridia bacterium]|nr:type II secretion system F family protein [Clostridia bacterium]
MLYLIMLLCTVTVFMTTHTLLGVAFRNRNAVGIRLERISKDAGKSEEDELSQPIFTRIVQPLLDDISKAVLKVTPKEIINALEKKVIMAGKPFNLGVKDWINLQAASVVLIPLLTIVTGYFRNAEVRHMVSMSIIGICFGMLAPNFMLSRKAAARQKKIANSLPDVLDLLTVSVEAGLGFDGALAKVIDKMPGPLAMELENVLQEMKVGKQKRDALKDMAERVNVQDLTTFVGSIIQADQLGVGIGNVLRIQSEQMRQKRRQRAQEKAMKAPVKMLIPMVLFIFPTIFSVLIGPIAIKVFRTLMRC